MKRRIAAAAALGLGLAAVVAAPAQAAPTATIHVPDDFVPTLSDTRTSGSYDVVGTGLRLSTTDTTREAKVAEYVATSTPLADVGVPSLDYTNTAGSEPGFQLVVDFDGNGTEDGILVGETVYGGDWWLNTAAAAFVKARAPINGGGSGSPHHGTLAQWSEEFGGADVTAFGFSLGSGVKGDGILNAITFAGTSYTFAEHTRLTGKAECKDGGWRTSTDPVFTNQGDCVSSFATTKQKKVAKN
jgi:hypothetical protein